MLVSFTQKQPILVGVTSAYLAISLLQTLRSGNTEFLFYWVSLAFIISVVLFLHQRIQFSAGVLWALSVWGAAHLAGGLVSIPESWPYDGEHAVLYSWWIIPNVFKYDQLVHAFGFGTCVFVCYRGLQSAWPTTHGEDSHETKSKPSLGFGPIVLCVFAACGLGAANEIVEFIATRISPETNVGGYVNTALDLVANFCGACIAAGILLMGRKRRGG